MKKIGDYRKLFGVTKAAELKELKTIYRNLIKEWHPDKFQDEEGKLGAEEKSRQIIEAYHFLVSIAPETREQMLPEYNETIATTLVDFSYKGVTLVLNFMDGSSYEYFEVPKATYTKLVNSDVPGHFARRHICHSFVYRKATKAVEA